MVNENGEWRISAAEFRGYVKGELEHTRDGIKQVVKLIEKRDKQVKKLIEKSEVAIKNRFDKNESRLDRLEKVWLRATTIIGVLVFFVTMALRNPTAFIQGIVEKIVSLFN